MKWALLAATAAALGSSAWLYLALRESNRVWIQIAMARKRPYDEHLALRLKP